MMPDFSQISKNRLSTCAIELQILFNHVIQFYDCTVVCGYRTKVDQEKAFNEGLSKVHYPGTHSTKPSIAVDVAPFEGNHIDWSRDQCAFFAGYVQATADRLWKIGLMKHRLRTGADWNSNHDINDTTFWDACHFELVLSDEEKALLKYFET
jgi:peptidoglycan L-alanyl-D-glutamate endopeptidase CwlK